MFGLNALKKWRKNKKKNRTEALSGRAKRDAKGTLNIDKDMSGYFCPNPFVQFDIYESGDAYSCCSGWLRLPLGNVKKMPAETLWNSEASQAIRTSILDGSFKYCDKKVCPLIQGDMLPTNEAARMRADYADIIDNKRTIIEAGPTMINFCNDPSCNLSCPSCRTEKIMLSSGARYDEKKAIHEKIVEAYLREPTEQAFNINVTGSGDPFGSKIFREFLFELNGLDFPNMTVNLQTNGVMFTPRNFERLHKIHDNLQNLIISLDAAKADTYAITRRGGDWEKLMENLAFLGKKRAEGYFRLMRLDFVVQVDNFRDMPAFIELATSFGVDKLQFSMVTDWGTWPKEMYESKCIWKESHPEFKEFIEVMKHPNFDNPKVMLGNVTAYRERALAAGQLARSA